MNNTDIFNNNLQQLMNNKPAQTMIVMPKVYYQTSTRNKSALELSYFLKAKGIKNNRFMLALYDPDLAGIDPYDPQLSLPMKIKVLKECQRNFWYFVREVVRVPSSGPPVHYQFNRGNLAYNFCASMNLMVWLSLSRQVGKTLAAEVYLLWLYNFATSNAYITIANKAYGDAKRNLDDIKNLRSLLPSYLQMDQTYSEVSGKKKRVQSTVTMVQHPFNHNSINIIPSARNAMSSANLLRGRRIHYLWIDEFAFFKFNDIMYINGMPALMRAFDDAKRNNSYYGFTITTTPGILSSDEGKFAYDMIQNATPFNEMWYDLTYQQIQDIINGNMNSNFVFIEFSYKALGLSEEWFYTRAKNMNWNMTAIRREILLEWIDTPENSPFNMDDIEALRGMVHDPIKTLLVLNKYNLNIYDTIDVNMNGIPINPPIIGVDVSGGYKRDYTAISVIDSKTTKYIAGLKCNYMSIPDLARVIIWMVRTMMPNAIVNIERNGVAKAISADRVTYQFPVLISEKKVKFWNRIPLFRSERSNLIIKSTSNKEVS